MKTILKILFLVLITSSLFSQKDYNNWVFGDGCYISFNTQNGKPKFVDSINIDVQENSSVISTEEGELAFYSFSEKLLNNKGYIINNSEIDGAWSSAQGGCLFKISEDHYVRIGSNYQNEYQSSNKFTLSCVNLFFSNNDTIITNKKIIEDGYKSEAIQVVKNNNKIYLVTTTVDENNFSIFNLYVYADSTFKHINKLEVNIINKFDYMKYNSFNQLILAVNLISSKIVLLKIDFENEKLEFKKSLSIPPEQFGFAGAEFSPNGNYVYYLCYKPYQISLNLICNLNGIDINNVFMKEYTSIPNPLNNILNGNIQIGPNHKIYISNIDSNYLSSIENPNNIDDIGYIEKSVDLKYTTCKSGLPNIPTSFYNQLSLLDSLFVCEDNGIQFTSELYAPFKDTIYSWTGPNDFVSNKPNPIISNVTKNDEGYYYLTVFNGDSSVSYQRKTYLNVFPNPKPEITVKPDTTICNNDFAELSVPLTYQDFEWTTGEKTNIITVLKSGVYGVTYTNENGCTGYAEVNITFEKDLTTNIVGQTKICKGTSTTLSADNDYVSYLWNTKDTTKSIEVDKVGQYILTVETSKGCIISDTIVVTNNPLVEAKLNPTPTTICNGDSTLLESKYDVPYYSYLWSTGDTTRGIYVNSTGTYKLKITDTRTGCKDSTEIAIKVEDNLQPTITGSNICSGESATLTALPNDPSYTYEWSNGETSPVITVNQAGTYSVTVSKNGCSGTAEFTVNESPSPDFEILGETIICNNETATLTASKDFAEYHWSTNEISKEIVVNQAGTYTLTVTDDNGCSATKSFTVNKYELKFDISKGSIDFGKVYITETKSDKTTITNHSGFEIKLANGQLVADGQSYPNNYDFVPKQLGVFANSIVIHVIEPCDTVITIPITARVYARTTISTKDIYTQIGRTETVPVYLQCEADLPSQEYTITADIDRSAFNTQDSYTINQNQPINKTKTKIHQLTGTILLSDKLEYDITFPSYSFTNPYIEVIEEPGKIYIDSVCIFPYRNVLLSEPTTLETNPNPATDELNISITTGVQGAMKLELVSTEGRVIYTDTWQQSTRSKELQINTRAIPSGLYQLRLITPIDAVTENVVVVE